MVIVVSDYEEPEPSPTPTPTPSPSPTAEDSEVPPEDDEGLLGD